MRKRRPPRRPYIPPTTSERLYVRVEPSHVSLLTFLLEAQDHLALPTVVDRFGAVVRLLFSPDAADCVASFLHDLTSMCPEAKIAFTPESCLPLASRSHHDIGIKSLAIGPRSSQPATLDTPMASPSHALPRILLADDNQENVVLLALYLEGLPYQLEMAFTGRQAVECHTARPYDLIFMDLEMPDMDGYQATEAIRTTEQQNDHPPVPILALTAHALSEHRDRCLQSGFNDFLVKPVRRAAILEALAKYLSPGAEASAPPSAPVQEDVIAPDKERLRKILPIFCKSCEEALAEAEQALEAGNLEQVRMQGHRIKGSARSYGFQELGQAGAAMEDAGQKDDGPAARTALVRARDLLVQARRELGL